MPVASSNDLVLWALSLVAIYKIASLLVGFSFGYLGYRLFMAGIHRSAGELEASRGSWKFKMVRTAPGTFFALFGAAIIAVTVFQGFDIEMPGANNEALALPEHPPMIESEVNNDPAN